jgi:hypothetical protein
MDLQNQEQKGYDIWSLGIGILIGAAILYLIMKGNQNTGAASGSQSQNSASASYENEEQWQIVRGEDGHIVDLKVLRNANVKDSDGINSVNDINDLQNYNNKYRYEPLEYYTKEQLDQKISDEVSKKMKELSFINNIPSKYNDQDRRHRFGMA